MKEEYVRKIVHEVEELATSKGLSLSRAAKLAGLDHGLVLRWKSGDVQPGIYSFHRLREFVEGYRNE